MAQDKIYITGATGRLGREVLKLIPEAIPLVRTSSGLPNEVVTEFTSDNLKYRLSDASAIIHLAGSQDFLDEKKTREGNVNLTYIIVDSAPKSAKIIFASSISVYGKKLVSLPATESAQTNPDTPYAKSKLEAESIVAKHPNHVILRIGPMYGEGFDAYFKVLKLIQNGKMRIMGNGDNHIPFVYSGDVAKIIKNSLSKGNGIYLLVGECLTQNEVYSIAAKELGAEPPSKHLTPWLSMAFAEFEQMKSSVFKTIPKFIPEDIAVLSSDRVFDCKKAKEELGFNPLPLADGIKEMVEILKSQEPSKKET